MSNSDSILFDVLVVGAGPAGLSLALGLVRGGARVALIERQSPAALAALEVDGRTTALAAGARTTLRELGAWEALEPEAGPIWDIRVSDRGSLLHLHFDHCAVGPEPMGHIVENHVLRRALLAALEGEPLLSPRWQRSVTGMEVHENAAVLTLDDGEVLRGRLVAAADGRGSVLRRMAGIGVRATDYDETAIVCTAWHERSHEGIAHERFLAGGPFAILPMADGPEGQHRASIVWTERRPLAEHLVGLPRADFERELARRFGDFLGRVWVPGDSWSYPLSLMLAKRLTGPRLALVGEAAHAMHPIAGQGFNVSMRDVEGLCARVGTALQTGADPGAPTALAAYARGRWPDILAMAAATDGLNRLFRNDLPPLALARRLGLGAVNRLPPLKRQFQRHAMGMLPFAGGGS
ncbi:MAG: UbiH/UbiF/VisC/COQ6 family ubiquinone biosynthesis hydroxylase [Alphaproteobacteria bacterium]|nr:UbiH/UbiF/VisC/COQ6 family ubiquinone biosynthesis hydroxylase [Alphaproteobacteria bacterium]MCB9928153.1 UbiH/UbiF/VisC/COQ6 family ubiquinone biosynthesis hydroxylase [Alphaproteobacteria bacterium]